MSNEMGTPSKYGLENHGLRNLNMVYWTLSTPSLIEQAVARHEGVLAHEGPLVVRTGQHTGRSAKDKFIVQHKREDDDIWWGDVNVPISPEHFERLRVRVTSYMQGIDVFVQDAVAGAHPDYQLPVRIVNEHAWHNLFARNMFIRRKVQDLPDHVPEFTVIHAPGCHANPDLDGTRTESFIVVDFESRLVLIGGTSYGGEMKKSIFSVLNYMLPKKGVLPMHCSANIGKGGDTALFFGLSGTGKTTLSSDTERSLIGDDEHGWGDDGVFNFEGGCYAKTIRLDPKLEPLIWGATRRFGTILENIVLDMESRHVDYDGNSFTENTRASYPLGFLPDVAPGSRGGHPQNVFFLTADAFGVLPPISRLTPQQAMYYFISGYTAKLAGTEKGLGKEPLPDFSACFGAPFLPLHPHIYAELLKEKINKHGSNVWLVNTGWTGGPFGVGKRMHLPHTRAMVRAALRGDLDNVPTTPDAFFGLNIPESVPGVPTEVLNPRTTWDDVNAYDEQAKTLIARFEENFTKYADGSTEEVINAGPSIAKLG